MTMKQLAQLAGLASSVGGAGTLTYKIAQAAFVTRTEYDDQVKERKAAEATHAIQLAGWQATLNQQIETNRQTADKIDALLLMMAGKTKTR